LDSTVAQLKCDTACVNTCVSAATTLQAKALCLDTCLCFATPAAPVIPSAPVVTPVEPAVAVLAEPLAAAQQTVIPADATPVAGT